MDLQISLSAFAFLFGELVQYCQTQVSNIGELERRWGRSKPHCLQQAARSVLDDMTQAGGFRIWRWFATT